MYGRSTAAPHLGKISTAPQSGLDFVGAQHAAPLVRRIVPSSTT
jgi:hypothetical protein